MPNYTVRVFQMQLLSGSADVSMTDVTPAQAAVTVLAAVEGNPDLQAGKRCYRLPDGRPIPLDLKDCVVNERTYCQVLDDEHRIIGLYGDMTRPEFMTDSGKRLVPDLWALLADLRQAAEGHRAAGGSFPLRGIGSLFEYLNQLDVVAAAALQLTTREIVTVRAVLNDEITTTSSNTKAALLTSALRKLPRP